MSAVEGEQLVCQLEPAVEHEETNRFILPLQIRQSTFFFEALRYALAAWIHRPFS
jgi:hypothetical protein